MKPDSDTDAPSGEDALTQLLQQLVAHPSRAGEDDCSPVLHVIAGWLAAHGVAHGWLRDIGGRPLGVCGEIPGARPGPTYVLNAPVDTAPYGDLAAWHHPPDRPTTADGWLYGRGSADSKAGIAVFCHVLAAIARLRDGLAGTVAFVFDADEHAGGFAGIRRYFEQRGNAPVAGVMIGYPGNDRLVVGARGFLRMRLLLHGRAGHSGSSRRAGINAIERACQLLRLLSETPLPAGNASFPLPPSFTATGIGGGGSFSLVPDNCALELDCRLTPEFPEAAARALVERLCARVDAADDAAPTAIEWLPGWPAYRLGPDDPMVRALAGAAAAEFGREIPEVVVGPSSIANYLSTIGVPATAGFGATYRNIHAPDECVRLASLEPTRVTYLTALQQLLGR
jgi:succinyl-diaminopimelate desuccinylase